jgi:hypothetical protein
MTAGPSFNPSELVDKHIADVADWRGKMLAHLRKTIHDADPEIIEELISTRATAINECALKNLIHAAMAFNLARLKGKTSAGARGIRAKADTK